MLPEVTAVRYVTPLKEGGSLPGIVEADDDGTYVLKFRGAGQGLKVLVAEVIVAGIARLIDVPVPDLAVVDLDARIARYEADEEVQDLLTASVGTNLGVDYLPGSLGYDGSRPAVSRPRRADHLARRVDGQCRPHVVQPQPARLARPHVGHRPRGGALLPPLLAEPRRPPPSGSPRSPSTRAVTCCATSPATCGGRHDELAAALTDDALRSVVADVPDEWLEPTAELADVAAVRAAYLLMLQARLGSPAVWLPAGAAA